MHVEAQARSAVLAEPLAPTASVIVPAFNAAADIPAALASVFAQSFAAYEVIVINDGSSDDLESSLRPFRDRILYIEQPNRGAAAARNAGIRAARGRYVAFLDADDVWHRDFLERQIGYLDSHPECDLVYSDALISGDTPLAGRRFMEGAPSREPVTLLSLLNLESHVLTSTVVVRRDKVMEVGLFDEALHRGHDYELWLRLTLNGACLAFQRDALAERRARPASLTGDTLTELQRPLAVMSRFAQRTDLPGEARVALQRSMVQMGDAVEVEMGKRRLLEGNFDAARHHLGATRRRSLKLRLALLGLRFAPGLMQRLYRAMRPQFSARLA
jgi:glycosyltransferase involved in cell wall biosynthesis